MANVLSIFGVLLLIGLAYPASLLLYWLTFPDWVARASDRIETQPRRCAWIGGTLLFLIIITCSVLLSAGSGVLQLLGWVLITVALAASLMGSAGLTAALGKRWQLRSTTLAPSAAYVRGAFTLEFAVLLPVIGWFIVLPSVMCVSLGAVIGTFKRAPAAVSPTLTAEV